MGNQFKIKSDNNSNILLGWKAPLLILYSTKTLAVLRELIPHKTL